MNDKCSECSETIISFAQYIFCRCDNWQSQFLFCDKCLNGAKPSSTELHSIHEKSHHKAVDIS